jgi:hypothetical protein
VPASQLRQDLLLLLLLNLPQTLLLNVITSFYEYAGFAITLNYHPAGRVVIKVYDHRHGVLGACNCGGLSARRGIVRSNFAQKHAFSVMVYTGALGSEVGFGGFGWVLACFVFSCHFYLGTSSNVLVCFFWLRRLGRGFFGIVVDSSFVIALVPSGGGASLSSGSLDVIVGGVSPCARPLGLRIVLMSGVNYRYTVIVRVGIRVGGWVRSVVGVPWPLLTHLAMFGCRL